MFLPACLPIYLALRQLGMDLIISGILITALKLHFKDLYLSVQYSLSAILYKVKQTSKKNLF